MKFDSYADPGHGWARVPKKLLTKLGIADQVSMYSRQRGEWAYLEEDCDLRLFVTALRATGVTVEFREHNTDKSSRIRNYERYAP